LENRRGEDDKMSKKVWEVVKTKVRKIGMVEIEREREETGNRKERREEERKEKEKTTERKKNRSKKSSRGIENLG